ncbi:MAG: hypothetical protein N4A63_14380 [Vallitalea sp.]|jgi:hypothetical protein|nr:hypothetical protein [Vallitalea sp.]
MLTNQNSNGSFPIANGVNYIRVFADGATFTPSYTHFSYSVYEGN